MQANATRLRDGLRAAGLDPLEGESAIVPVIVGETAVAIELSKELLERGVYVTGFGYPVVPEGTARIRIQASAALSDDQIDSAVATIAELAQAKLAA